MRPFHEFLGLFFHDLRPKPILCAKLRISERKSKYFFVVLLVLCYLVGWFFSYLFD